MKQGRRFGLSAEQKLDVWRRWKAGQTLHEIGRAFGASAGCLVLRHGGIAPAKTPPSKTALYQMVLHRLFEPAALTRHVQEHWPHRAVAVSNIAEDVVRRILPTLILLALAAAISPTAPPTPYPHELPHFKFYAEYLSPLEPYISDLDSVVRVLGSDQGRDLRDWRIQPLWVGKGNTVNGRPWAKDITGRLATIAIRPKQRVSMNVKFPKEFIHTSWGVSEVNVLCGVYRDDSGLAYWIYAKDSAVGKKGDLMTIEYGPSNRLMQEIEGSSQYEKWH